MARRAPAHRRAALTAMVLLASTVASACGATPAGPAPTSAPGVPQLAVTPIATGLDHPWDVRPLPDGALLFTQRDRATLSVWRGGRVQPVAFPSDRIWVSGETGLMGLEVDPAFASNHLVYTCQGWKLPGGGHDVRVISWRLDDRESHATLVRPLVTGLPSTSGRHGGCRLLITRDGALNVGTGDAATGTNPESLTSLGGKTLRLDRSTGRPWPRNPFIHAADPVTRYLTSYGHRNVQGLAQRADATLWSIEQGTYRDDEVNLIRAGGDYGYDPLPGYNESVPMTDQSLPGTQIAARWSSGPSTIATSGGTFVPVRAAWGSLSGALAVAALKGSLVLFLTFDASGRLVGSVAPPALHRYGRMRTVVDAPDGDLLATTDNGAGHDAILRVHPGG